MRSTCRLFLAAILFITAAGIASAQDASAAPPPAPDVAKPVDQLQPIPFAGANAFPVEPGITVDPSVLPVVPVAAAPVEAPVAPAAERPVAAAIPRVTKKTAKRPAVHVSESFLLSAPAINPATVQTTELPPAAAPIAPLKSIEPPPAAASTVAVDPLEATKSQPRTGMGTWFLAGIVVAALFGMITLLRRRKSRSQASIPDFTGAQDLKPVLASRH